MLIRTDPAFIGFAEIVIRLLGLHLPGTQPLLLGFEIQQVVILIAMTVYNLETEEFNPVVIGTVLTEKVMPNLFTVLFSGRWGSLLLASREGYENKNNRSQDRKLHKSCFIGPDLHTR